MKKRKNAVGWYILFLVSIVLGLAFIALYPFKNRNLSVHFISDKGEHVVELTNYQIKNDDCTMIEFAEEEDSFLVKKVRYYAGSRSIILKETGTSEFYSMINLNASADNVQWVEDGVLISAKGENSPNVLLNERYTETLQELSASYGQERIIMGGLYISALCVLAFIYMIVRERRTENNWNNHGPLFELQKFGQDIKKYRQYMVYAAETDLKAEVANSYLNRLWWLLEPFFNMLVYVIVFGNLMGNSIENYATFVFSALLMWNFFNKTVNYSVKLVRNNKDIITKVYIPKFILLLSNMILNFMKLLFSLIVLVVMMLVFRIGVGFNILWVIPAYVVMMLLAFGIGMIFLHFGVYVDDLSYAVGILMNMLMFLSGIFYDPMTTLPDPLNMVIMCLNPVAAVVDTMRNALLCNTASNLPIIGMWFCISIILCCVGVHIVYKNENSYVKIV